MSWIAPQLLRHVRRAVRSVVISLPITTFVTQRVPGTGTPLLRVALVVLALAVGQAHSVTIDWVPIGNPGNAGELSGTGAGGYGPTATVGSVAYKYWISRYEVTNSQYVEFLNAKDPTGANVLGLYDSAMTSDPQGGIDFTAGNVYGSKYSVQGSEGNRPVVFINWYDAVRFANWLHNGQGSGDTETGAYTLGPLQFGVPLAGLSITRNAWAKVFLPSEDEWYKAAYYNPGNATYFDYPTATDLEPYSDEPPGDDSPTQSNVANYYRNDGLLNYYNDGYAVTGSTGYNSNVNYLTDVGAYLDAPSPYGTFDQGGNVWEWNEAVIYSQYRGFRGGGWPDQFSSALRASSRYSEVPTAGGSRTGFRLAMIPEPTSLGLAVIGTFGLLCLRRRHR